MSSSPTPNLEDHSWKKHFVLLQQESHNNCYSKGAEEALGKHKMCNTNRIFYKLWIEKLSAFCCLRFQKSIHHFHITNKWFHDMWNMRNTRNVRNTQKHADSELIESVLSSETFPFLGDQSMPRQHYLEHIGHLAPCLKHDDTNLFWITSKPSVRPWEGENVRNAFCRIAILPDLKLFPLFVRVFAACWDVSIQEKN